MAPVADNYGPAEAAWRGIAAGQDLVLMPVDPADAVAGIAAAAKDGSLPADRLQDAATAVYALRLALARSPHPGLGCRWFRRTCRRWRRRPALGGLIGPSRTDSAGFADRRSAGRRQHQPAGPVGRPTAARPASRQTLPAARPSPDRQYGVLVDAEPDSVDRTAEISRGSVPHCAQCTSTAYGTKPSPGAG